MLLQDKKRKNSVVITAFIKLQVTGALGEVPKKNREDQNLFWDSCVFFFGAQFCQTRDVRSP